MNDENERSVASTGSVEPVAWGVAGSKGLLYATSVSRMDAVDMQSEHECETHVVPLYRRPPCQDFSQKNLTLTDAEREAVRYMIAAGKFGQRDEALTEEHADTLRGLLERHGGGE
jgi:1,6-anhydro-N-acetylmuramate kinase